MKINNREAAIWLAAVIDTDGCLTWSYNKRRCYVYPRIDVANSNTAIIERASQVMKQLCGKAHITTQGRTAGNRKMRNITVVGMARTFKLLTQIEPFLVGKKEQAQLLMQFVKSRTSRKATKPFLLIAEEKNWLLKVRSLNSGKLDPKTEAYLDSITEELE